MSPSVVPRASVSLSIASLAATAFLISATSPGLANTNLAAAWNVPSLTYSKVCSRAFRFAARAENGEVGRPEGQLTVSIRHLIRMRDPKSIASNTNFDAWSVQTVTALCGSPR
jgi:hypothetical protein